MNYAFRLTSKSFKTKRKRYSLADGEGLSVDVFPTGKKKWIVSYRVNGKQTRKNLGEYPELGCKDARQLARQCKAEVLKEQLGESKKYVSVKAVENKTGRKYNWRNLKKSCLEKGREIKDIADPNFGTVKIYPKEAREEVYGIELKRIFG